MLCPRELIELQRDPQMLLRSNSSTASHAEVQLSRVPFDLSALHAEQPCLLQSSWSPCDRCQYHSADISGRAHQVKDDVSSAHEGSGFQGAIRAQQHHMLKALLGEELPGHVVIASHHPQRIGLCPLWHPAFTERAFTYPSNCTKAQALQCKLLCRHLPSATGFPAARQSAGHLHATFKAYRQQGSVRGSGDSRLEVFQVVDACESASGGDAQAQVTLAKVQGIVQDDEPRV